MNQQLAAAFDIVPGILDAWRGFILFVPKLVAFIVILAIGWIIAALIAKAVNVILTKVGFDRVVERGGIKRALDRSKYDASDIVAKLLFWTVFLITLQLAFGVFGPNPVSVLLAAIVAWLPRAAVAIIIVVIAAAIATGARDLIVGALGGLSYGRLLGTLASAFILGLGIIAALNQIGVATAVTTPVLIAILATLGGIAVIGVGGGLIKPMQQRWDVWLGRAEQDIPRMREREREREQARVGAGAPGQTGVEGQATREQERAERTEPLRGGEPGETQLGRGRGQPM